MGLFLKLRPNVNTPRQKFPEECERVPTDPPFTLKQLKDAIPTHCFKRSLVKSLMYVAFDFAVVFLLYSAAMWLYNSSSPVYVQCVLWPVYWITQSCFAFGVWILAHECGHYAFCESKLVCDVIGLLLHTSLLVPYHSWRITHSKHHSNTNRMDGDEAFVPNTRSLRTLEKNLEFPSALRRFCHLVNYLVFGWPAYLFVHSRGRVYSQYSMHPNHFNPRAPIFCKKDFAAVVLSDVALLVWIGFLYYMSAYVYSYTWLLFLYGVPYLGTNAWLVTVTYLQHTDVKVPHYDDDEWTWMKGALCTVDRDYGVLNHVFHHLPDTHVAHHLFPYLPHYHAVEATESLKPILGKYYAHDETPVWRALWITDSFCRFVEDEGSIRWYKHSPEQ